MPRTLALLAALLLGPTALAQSLPAWAEPGPPSPPPGPEAPSMMPPTPPGGGSPPTQVPLDGGLGLLALAGGAYAGRRLRGQQG